jgi:hypothetical protein
VIKNSVVPPPMVMENRALLKNTFRLAVINVQEVYQKHRFKI